MDSITIQAYWNQFLPTVQKLLKEKHEGKIKHACVGENWWKSRYSDFLTDTAGATTATCFITIKTFLRSTWHRKAKYSGQMQR